MTYQEGRPRLTRNVTLATAALTCGWSAKHQADGDPRPSGPGFGVAMRDGATRRDVHLRHGHAGPLRRPTAAG
jgi:hypothetical protein